MARRTLVSQAITQLNVHLAIVGALLLFDLVLATRLIVAWERSHSDQSAQYSADMATYGHLQAQAEHIQALPAQLSTSRRAADAFVANRIPVSDSEMLAELGTLTSRNHVRLSRASYTPAPAIPGLLELRVEANVSGEYGQIMHFINDVERDKNHSFFIIRSITLTGQQGGLVNLRVRLTTYMRQDAATAAVLQSASRAGEAGGGSTGSGEEE
ncbi:hypothetical protein [Acidipila sp. EB88]|uniref:hypothetical protein n=1 Tax=Acidipila sp. EB88 TaxID=2305226 RepID=UPI000F5FA878|nr:hypothetical protein [Acidipila sp. EB88]RRA48975.1 hypothetical protein D1Y84_12520 [Acidipila sp. EB88]